MQILPAILIYLVVPPIGLGAFLLLRQRMIREGADIYLLIEYFLLFITYGGLLLEVLTSLLWYSSGQASLVVFYLVLIAPVVMGVIAYRNFIRTKESVYYFWAYRLSILYFLIAPIIFLLFYLLDDSF